jgi:tRNA (mo5U34)-methyltransferase
VAFWWHSIEVAPGVITPGHKTVEQHQLELASFRFPDLHEKTVLDIGGWDGFYAFEAERLGASRVAVLDHYVWSIDYKGLASRESAGAAEQDRRFAATLEQSEFWRPHDLPGKAGFDTARRLRGSRVEEIVGDLMTMPLDAVGQWDVVLFLGVLYHLQDPLGALRRLSTVTKELAVLETQAVSVGGHEDASVWEFYPADELAGDPTNWFAPSAAALRGALLAVGFTRVEMLVEQPAVPPGHIGGYRAVAHAFK